MTDYSANAYQRHALRTETGSCDDSQRLVQGLMGLAGEAGEAIDILKKNICSRGTSSTKSILQRSLEMSRGILLYQLMPLDTLSVIFSE